MEGQTPEVSGTRWHGGTLTVERWWQGRLDGVGRLSEGLDAAHGKGKAG